jgi:hypothetical protein
MIAERVARRWVAATQITKEYVAKLKALAEKDPSTFWSSPPVLKQLYNRLDMELIDPFPLSELAGYLLGRNVDEDEVKVLIKTKAPRQRKPKTVDFVDAFLGLEKLTGVSAIVDMSLEHEPWAGNMVTLWGKGYKAMKPKAKKVFSQYVKKIKLRKPRGSEDASWDGGVLVLTLKPQMSDYKTMAGYLTHEMGHALEEGANVDLWSPPWGEPPFISDYAEWKPNVEDFAESFFSYVIEPSLLKRKAPAKYEALRGLVR